MKLYVCIYTDEDGQFLGGAYEHTPEGLALANAEIAGVGSALGLSTAKVIAYVPA